MTLPACWCLWSSREVSHWAPSVLCLQRVANDAWPLIADQLRRRGYEGQLLMDQRDIRYSQAHDAIAQAHVRRSHGPSMETLRLVCRLISAKH